jgi:L-lactate dehydrogenase complex protein LldF
LFRWSGKMGRKLMKPLAPLINHTGINPWSKQRIMPEPPKESFRDWYINNQNDKNI